MSNSKNLVLVIFSILLIAAVGYTFQSWYEGHGFKSFSQAVDWLQSCQIITLVFAVREIPKGTVITSDAIEKVYRWQPGYPQSALSDTRLAIGKVARFSIQAGQIVASQDVGPGKVDE